MDKPLTLNDAVKPVALPSSDAAAPAVGTKMTISGWGTLTVSRFLFPHFIGEENSKFEVHP